MKHHHEASLERASAVGSAGRRGARRALALSAAALLIAAALAGAGPVAVSTGAADAVACTLVHPAKVRSIVGLQQSLVVRNYDGTAAIAEAQRTECGLGLWSGSPPASSQAAFQLARSGRGAQVGIETWAPHQSSQNVGRWLSTDYDKLVGKLEKESVSFPGLLSTAGWPSHHLEPPRLGHDAAGLTTTIPKGPAKGLAAAIGCWWNDKRSSVICLFDEEATGKPIVKHLEKLAKIAVPAFLGK